MGSYRVFQQKLTLEFFNLFFNYEFLTTLKTKQNLTNIKDLRAISKKERDHSF